MIKPIKYAAVNWVDGMKISEKHFIQHQNFIIDTVRDASSVGIKNFNYGLLRLPYKKIESLESLTQLPMMYNWPFIIARQ